MALRQLQLQCAVCGELTPHHQKAVNHPLHAVLSLFTGIWVIAWIALSTTEHLATCGRCGTQRSAKGPPMLLLPASAEGPRLEELDESLRKLKGPLFHCRKKHGIGGNVTFRLRYDALGSIVGVTVDDGPPNMTPGFIQDSAVIIKGMLTVPRTANGGVMRFTDLAPPDADPYRS